LIPEGRYMLVAWYYNCSSHIRQSDHQMCLPKSDQIRVFWFYPPVRAPFESCHFGELMNEFRSCLFSRADDFLPTSANYWM
jgi:hypothetical protein